MAGEFDWLAQLLTGIGSLATARPDINFGREFAGMADPFSQERGAYQANLRDYMGANAINPSQVTAGTQNALGMLQNLLQNPGSIVHMPGYQFGLNQALEAVNRGAGASGMLNSGNRLAALQDRGEGYARDWYNTTFNQLTSNIGSNINAANLGLNAQRQGYDELANLAGVNAGSPAAAAGLLERGRQNQLNSIGAGIGGLANAGAGLLGGGLQAIQRLLSGGGGSLGSVLPGGGIDYGGFTGIGDQAGWPGELEDWFGLGNANGSWDVLPDIGGSWLDDMGSWFGSAFGG